jgi:predicted Fe-Mo cluster-binding NifX family protein
MKLCIPVLASKGLKSTVSPHFGGAPYFIIVDTENNAVEEVQNQNEHHAHGMCHPLKSLQGILIDAMICSGIGAGALNKLHQAGIKVYNASGETVEELVNNFKGNKMEEINPDEVCRNHGCH